MSLTTATEHMDMNTLFWRHEQLHRRVLPHYSQLAPWVRERTSALEDRFNQIDDNASNAQRWTAFQEHHDAIGEWLERMPQEKFSQELSPPQRWYWRKQNTLDGIANA